MAAPDNRDCVANSMRRALSIFRNEVHGKTFSIAAAHDVKQLRTRWWTHRQGDKTFANDD